MHFAPYPATRLQCCILVSGLFHQFHFILRELLAPSLTKYMLKKSEETLTQTVSNIAAGKVSFTHNAHNCNHKPPRVSGQYTHTHTSKVFLYSIWQFSLQLSVLERISTPTHVHTYKHSHTHCKL